jgi:hypothetical protein
LLEVTTTIATTAAITITINPLRRASFDVGIHVRGDIWQRAHLSPKAMPTVVVAR